MIGAASRKKVPNSLSHCHIKRRMDIALVCIVILALIIIIIHFIQSFCYFENFLTLGTFQHAEPHVSYYRL